MNEDLNRAFLEAYKKASTTKIKIAPDVKLRIYGYYKQATFGGSHNFESNENDELIRAFKFNAWQQVRHLTQEEAKKAYIRLINSLAL